MKIKVLAIALLVAGFAFSTQAQDAALKIGYANVDYILSQMPETKQVESELADYQKQLSTQLESKMQTFQTKLADYQNGAPNMIPEVRADKEAELQQLQQSIQEFEQNAATSLQNKQLELLQPLYDKVQNNIDEVAKAEGYTYVFSTGQGLSPVLLYANDKYDISKTVLTKMGITPVTAEE